jgi:hypothetical protein
MARSYGGMMRAGVAGNGFTVYLLEQYQAKEMKFKQSKSPGVWRDRQAASVLTIIRG